MPLDLHFFTVSLELCTRYNVNLFAEYIQQVFFDQLSSGYHSNLVP